MPQLGEVAYNAYANSRSWRTFNGDTMPTWDSQQKNIREGWQQSAEAVVSYVFDNPEHEDGVEVVLLGLVEKYMANKEL